MVVWSNGLNNPPPPKLGMTASFQAPNITEWEAHLTANFLPLRSAVLLTCDIQPQFLIPIEMPQVYHLRLNQIIEYIERNEAGFKLISQEDQIENSMVYLADVCEYCKKRSWTIPIALEAVIPKVNKPTGHKLDNREKHEMHAPFKVAYDKTPEPKSNLRVWATLRDMASQEPPYSPLVGFKGKDGAREAAIYYRKKDGNEAGYTYKHFTDKIARHRNREP